MDNELDQQLIYLGLYGGKWISSGSKVWDFTNTIDVDINLYGVLNLTTSQLVDIATQLKRDAKYAQSLAYYIKAGSGCFDNTGKIPIMIIRGLVKTLICVNDFKSAYVFASTVLADMQQRGDASAVEMALFESYYHGLINLTLSVVDAGDLSSALAFSAKYAGNVNYRLVKTIDEIVDNLKSIRIQIKNVYGM